MKKPTNWDLYLQKQMGDPDMKGFIEEELKALRVGSHLAQLRQRKGMSQTQLAAKVGMSGPNISRIETSTSQNLTLETMLRLFAALDCEVVFSFKRRRHPRLRAARA